MSTASFRVSDETTVELRSWLAEERRDEEDPLVGPALALSMADWTRLAPEPRVGILSFEDFPFQAPTSESSSGPGLGGLYSDEVAEAESVVVAKGTQVGVSAWAWRWAARQADQFADRVLYIFPTDRHVTEFGRERIDPAITESEYLSRRSPPGVINNQHQKRIGDGWIFLRGTTRVRPGQRAAGAQSVAAQSIVFDEYDDLDPATVSQMERRLTGAAQTGGTARVRRVGVPTVDNYGVALAYARSDRRKWYVTCPDCGEEHVPEWKNVRWTTSQTDDVCSSGHDVFDNEEDVVEAWRVCPHCETEIDVRDGRWLAENPGAHSIGFHISRLIVPGADLKQIIKASRGRKQYEIEAFHQNDLGEPYTSAESGIGRDVLEAACSMGTDMVSYYDGALMVTAGLDVAGSRDLNMRISLQHEDGSRTPLWIGTVSSFEEAAEKMDLYRIRMLAVDHLPETRSARRLAADFPGRVILARYDEDVKEAVYIDEANNMIAANRTQTIDAVLEGIRAGRIRLPRLPPRKYLEHLMSQRRRLEFDTRGRPTYRYITVGNDGDDFVHAEVYDLMAREYVIAQGLAAVEDSEEVISGGMEEVDFPRLAEDYEGRGWRR